MPKTRAAYKRPIRDPSDNKYHINGRSYRHLFGTRKQVWLDSAFKTSGGLTKSDLVKNKSGEIVSKSKHTFEKNFGRLEKAGWTACKGKFGGVKIRPGRTRAQTRKLTCPSNKK